MKHPCVNCERYKKGCGVLCVDILEYNVLHKPSISNKYSASYHESQKARCERLRKRKELTKNFLGHQNISYVDYIRNDVVVNCL